MYYCDTRLQYPVRVEKPNPLYAKMLQQAIGGVEGEMRVCLQYFFQAWGQRGPKKYRDMLLQTAAEEIGHIEMLATAVALNLRRSANLHAGSSSKGWRRPCRSGRHESAHYLSAGLAALPVSANGVPFDSSNIYASGNIAGDMLANACAESTGRILACWLWEMTDDPGMKDMLSFMIARDTMHQQQWLAVIEELGGLKEQLPIPNSFPQSKEMQEYSYAYFTSSVDGKAPTLEGARFTQGESLDGNGKFSIFQNRPLGEEPKLAPGPAAAFSQKEQHKVGILGTVKEAVLGH